MNHALIGCAALFAGGFLAGSTTMEWACGSPPAVPRLAAALLVVLVVTYALYNLLPL